MLRITKHADLAKVTSGKSMTGINGIRENGIFRLFKILNEPESICLCFYLTFCILINSFSRHFN